MIEEKVNILEKEILFKSPVEYKIKFLQGSPVYYLVSSKKDKDLKELIALDTNTMEYFLLETSKNFDALYEKAMKLTYAIMDEIWGILDPEKRDKKIEEVLNKQLKEYFEEKENEKEGKID